MKLILIASLLFTVPTHAQEWGKKIEFNLETLDLKKSPLIRPYKSADGEDCVLKTMPSTVTQDGLGICFAASASYLWDESNCYTKKNTDCESVPKADKHAQIDLARFSRKDILYDMENTDRKRDRYEYEGIFEGGDMYTTMLSSWYANSTTNEACAPMDQALIGISDDAEAQMHLWNAFRKAFFDENNKLKCSQCAAGLSDDQATDIKEKYQIRQDAATIKKALSQDTYEKALDELLIPSTCKDFENTLSTNPAMDYPKIFPNVKGMEKGPTLKKIANTKTDEYLKNIKEVVCEKKRPIAYSFCAINVSGKPGGRICKDGAHSVVIEGYGEQCDAKGKSCKPVVKVRNSWGEKWQKENNDGWVDARNLMEARGDGTAPMVWLEKDPNR